MAGAVEDAPRNDPPATANPGACYIIGQIPTGDWSQYPDHVATFGTAGWRFVAPVAGTNLLVKASGLVATFGDSGWEIGTVRAAQLMVEGNQVVGPRASAIGEPAGGSVIDDEARSTIGQILAALRQHGLISP